MSAACTGRYIEGVENLRPGASVVVLEDVVTTGGSSLKAGVKFLSLFGCGKFKVHE